MLKFATGTCEKSMHFNKKTFGPIIFLIFLVASIPIRVVSAHDMKMAGVKVLLDSSRVTVSVVAHLHQLNAADVAGEVSRRLRLRLDGKPFVAENTRVTIDQANGIAIWQGARSGAAATVALDAPIFPEQATGGTVLTVFRGGVAVGEALVTAGRPSAEVGPRQPPPPLVEVVFRFVREGILHIFTGPDHMLFIFGLLLLGGSMQQLLKVVTAFTLAHSITLTLAATGVCTLPSCLVEPAIALSIVAVAIENLRAANNRQSSQGARDVRPLIAFAFGLIHGFGFAGALSEVGLPPHALGWALASFNIGVELGQATIVLICAPLLAWLSEARPKISQRFVYGGSWGVAAMGAFWFVQRI